MPLRWCAFTGALMIAFVFMTFLHTEVSQNPDGVQTRWWDGTTQSVERKHENGTLAVRTEYGDDGKTVIKHMEWTQRGVLIHSKVRLQSGHVEEKRFSNNGAIAIYKLWLGDEQLFVIERSYHLNGKVEMETINTEDGLATIAGRMFDESGRLIMESKVLDNADQQSSNFRDGKLASRNTFKANGDNWEELFYEDGSLKLRIKTIRLTGEKEGEGYTKSGRLLFKLKGKINGLSVREVYDEHGKVRLRQIYERNGLVKVEEVSVHTGKVTTAFIIDEYSGTLGAIHKFRPDGTLELVKQLKRGKNEVAKTIEYDAAGQSIVSQKAGGEPEKYDEDVFLDELGLLSRAEGKRGEGK